MKKQSIFSSKGQAQHHDGAGQALITLLFFLVIGASVTSAAVFMLFRNIAGAGSVEQGTIAYYAAEAGIENAVLRILRSPSYAGETLTIGNASVTVTTAKSGDVIFATATATLDNVARKIQLKTRYNNNVLEVFSWKEIE